MSNPSSPLSSWPPGWGDSPMRGWRESPKWPNSPLYYDGLGFGSLENSSPRVSSRSPSPRSPSPRSPSPRSPSPRPLPITQERGHSPRIFVISCHGVTFTDPDPSKLGVPATINPVHSQLQVSIIQFQLIHIMKKLVLFLVKRIPTSFLKF
jgi:hypothetical protein